MQCFELFKQSLTTASNVISKAYATSVVFGQDAFQKSLTLYEWEGRQIEAIEVQNVKLIEKYLRVL